MLEPDRCLICYQTLDGGGGPSGSGSGFSTISKELNSVFILRKIFEVPLESLSNHMVDTEGTNPSEWIRLCDGTGGGGTCKIMVDKAKRMYKEVLDANRRFRKVKGDIIQFLRRNQRRLKTGGGGRRNISGSFGMEITDQTRKFVSDHDYSESLVDPFIGGDCQAEKLLYSSNIVPEIDDAKLLRKIIKEERCQDDKEDNEDYLYQEDTFYGDNLEENEDQSYLSSPSASTTPTNDNDDDKDPLYESESTLKTNKRRGGKTVNPKKEEEVPHIPGATSKIGDDGEDQWYCSCGRVYTSSMQLRRHVKEATMEESCMYFCPLCGKGFRRRWDVKRHLRHTHGHGEEDISKVMEGIPKKKEKKLEAISQHSDCQEKSEQEQVPVAGSSTTGGHTFEEESQKMEDGTEYWKCSCGKIYLGRETLLKHVKEVMGEENEVDGRGSWVSCGICGMKFKRRFELNRHMKLKHDSDVKVGAGRKVEEMEVDGGGDQEEEEVGGLAKKKREIVRKSEGEGFGATHEQGGLLATLEDGTEQWQCSCGRLYGSKEAMCRHVKEKNLDPSMWIGCPHCVKRFTRRSLLKRHVDGVHSKKKGKKRVVEVECETCGESFMGVGNLKIHQRNTCLNALGTSQDETVEGVEMGEEVEEEN